MSTGPFAITGARLVDPDSGYDGPGCVIVAEGVIADVVRAPGIENASADMTVINAGGAVLVPGLIDLRVKTGEPGSEPKETLKSASRAAAKGGVTSMVLQPDTDPAIDDPAMVDFILRRARDIEGVHVYPAGAATRRCEGQRMAEIGLMHEAGAVYFTDADRSIVDSRVFRRVLAYAKAFGATVAHRPADPFLTAGACATEGELAGRLGLPAAPAVAERIMLERDLALAELTGARLLVDQITTADALESLQRAKAKGVDVFATVSINHLSFNEVDIGDFRTFYRLDPPLRAEADRQALIEALASGLIDGVVSAHAPAPAEDKRLPFSESTPRDPPDRASGPLSRRSRALDRPDPRGDLHARKASWSRRRPHPQRCSGRSGSRRSAKPGPDRRRRPHLQVEELALRRPDADRAGRQNVG
jgi:dihydroorotase